MFNYETSIQLLEKRIEERWGQTEFNSSLDIHSLLDARTHFTSLYAFLGEKEASCYREYKLAEKARKRAYMESKATHMESGDNGTVSGTKAELDIQDKYDSEIEAESEYKLWRFRRESVNETLSTLGQLISFLKQERGQSDNQFLK